MQEYHVKAGKHRFSPVKWGIVFFKKKLSAKVRFDYDCKYDIGNNQTDINKLFGVGWFPHHHINSARWGWRWSPEKEKIELFAYIYSKRKRISEHVDDVAVGQTVFLSIIIHENKYTFILEKKNRAPIAKIIEANVKSFGYKLGAYFGGNIPAPHKMSILIENGNN